MLSFDLSWFYWGFVSAQQVGVAQQADGVLDEGVLQGRVEVDVGVEVSLRQALEN